MSVGDLSKDQLLEVADYLEGFPASDPNGEDSDPDPEQYWFSLAEAIRERTKGQFQHYTTHYLTNLDLKGNGAVRLLRDLAKHKLNFELFLSCLKEVDCQKALNAFTRTTVPVIMEQPLQRRMQVKNGELIKLTVVAKCDPGKPIYHWFKNQKNPLEGHTSNTLLIHNANTSDTGHYHCRVTNPKINDPWKASVFSEYVHVEVEPPVVVNNNPNVRQEIGERSYQPSLPPVITHHPSSITCAPDQRISLECKAQGAVIFDWYKNNQSIKQGCPDGVLILEAPTLKDSGEYYCVVRNDDGHVQSKMARVAVDTSVEVPRESKSKVMIMFEKQPQEKTKLCAGEELKLSCKARSVTGDKVVYQWFKVEGRKTDKYEKLNTPDISVSTSNIERKLEIDLYCQVSLTSNPNVVAQSRTARVIVNTIWFTKQPQSIEKAYIGNEATLTCTAEGVGRIKYMWLRSSTSDGQFILIRGGNNESGVLHLRKLQQADWGYYQCQADNVSDFIKSDTVFVRPTIHSVKRTDSFKLPLIRIVKQPWSYVVQEKGKFRIICEAVCTAEDELLHYQWYHCGGKIHGATEPAYVRDSISEEDCGPYYCEVRCSNNPAAIPAISKTARVELASECELHRQIRGKNGPQLEQMEAEMTLKTKKEERYAREKVALLVGNQHYVSEDINDLRSPENDIRQLRNLLEKELNFKVISFLDLTHAEMMHALERFYEMLTISGVYALFYYSGHGFVTSAMKNYLIPVDADPSLTCEQNIHVDTICGQMRKKLSRAIVVLDSCRVKAKSHKSLPSMSDESNSLSSLETDESITSANYVQITSCQDNNPAFDAQSIELSPVSTPCSQPQQQLASKEAPCSYFNSYFRQALKEKKTGLYTVFQFVLQKMTANDNEANVAGQQRPLYTGSLLDDQISLHDEVFLDSDENESKLNKILTLYQQAHYVPDTVLMDSSEHLGELCGLTKLELSFTYEFSNVLCVHVKLYLLLGDQTSQAIITCDKEFLKGQGVSSKQTKCTFQRAVADGDGCGQGEPPDYFMYTMIKISSIQKLHTEYLSLLLSLSLQTEGKDRRANINYRFPKKPLFASLN